MEGFSLSIEVMGPITSVVIILIFTRGHGYELQ